MPAENLHMRIRLREDAAVRHLERLLEAVRSRRTEWRLEIPPEVVPELPEGGLVTLIPEPPVHYNAPCEPPNPVAVLRDLVREHFGAEADRLVDGEGFRAAERILEQPAFQPGGLVLACSDSSGEPCDGPLHCPICAGREAILRTVNSSYPRMVRHALSSMAPTTWVAIGSEAPGPPPPPSYTAETAALEAIRDVMAIPGDLLEGAQAAQRASYRPAEGPTSACFDCGKAWPPADLWVGKRSGIALGDCCMPKWERAGRARRTGEF